MYYASQYTMCAGYEILRVQGPGLLSRIHVKTHVMNKNFNVF